MNERRKNNPFRGTFGNLENLADTISEVLNCPVTIEDRNHRLLAYSTHENSTDPARVATIIGRRVPEKVINSLWKDGVIPKLQQSDNPVRVQSIAQVGLGDRVAVAIRKNDEVLGYIWVLEVDHRLDEHELTLLKQAAQTAKNQLLQLQTGTKKKQENRQELFWTLLTGNGTEDEMVHEKLQMLGIVPTLPVTVLILELQLEISPDVEKDILYLSTVNQKIKVLLSAADGPQMILLISPAEKDLHSNAVQSFIQSFFTHMEERFGVTDVKAVFGSLVNTYKQVNKSYREALSVLAVQKKLGGETVHLHGYDELGIYQYLDAIYDIQQKENYENRFLQKISAYDQLHNTNLYETLETFLSLNENVHATADIMHIHLNTLTYRLKRITEISQLDLKNPDQKLMVYIDLKMKRLF